jgi:hypothetical protein
MGQQSFRTAFLTLVGGLLCLFALFVGVQWRKLSHEQRMAAAADTDSAAVDWTADASVIQESAGTTVAQSDVAPSQPAPYEAPAPIVNISRRATTASELDHRVEIERPGRQPHPPATTRFENDTPAPVVDDRAALESQLLQISNQLDRIEEQLADLPVTEMSARLEQLQQTWLQQSAKEQTLRIELTQSLQADLVPDADVPTVRVSTPGRSGGATQPQPSPPPGATPLDDESEDPLSTPRPATDEDTPQAEELEFDPFAPVPSRIAKPVDNAGRAALDTSQPVMQENTSLPVEVWQSRSSAAIRPNESGLSDRPERPFATAQSARSMEPQTTTVPGRLDGSLSEGPSESALTIAIPEPATLEEPQAQGGPMPLIVPAPASTSTSSPVANTSNAARTTSAPQRLGMAGSRAEGQPKSIRTRLFRPEGMSVSSVLPHVEPLLTPGKGRIVVAPIALQPNAQEIAATHAEQVASRSFAVVDDIGVLDQIDQTLAALAASRTAMTRQGGMPSTTTALASQPVPVPLVPPSPSTGPLQPIPSPANSGGTAPHPIAPFLSDGQPGTGPVLSPQVNQGPVVGSGNWNTGSSSAVTHAATPSAGSISPATEKPAKRKIPLKDRVREWVTDWR